MIEWINPRWRYIIGVAIITAIVFVLLWTLIRVLT